jgi:DNA processing protein
LTRKRRTTGQSELPLYEQPTIGASAPIRQRIDSHSDLAQTGCSPRDLLGPMNDLEQKNAPARIYAAGDVAILEEGARVSIVGSRKASPLGLKRASEWARFLASNNVVVVSGLAEGIDTAAHLAAIESGGRTVAVIGTPLDQTYPAKNKELQHRLMREHLVLSQFASGERVFRSNFPARNRTMALISDATVIVEASNSSGSLSQGWEALRLGRMLFIARPILDDPTLTWPGEMISYGAVVLSENTLDLLLDVLPLRTASLSHARLSSCA